MKLLTVAGRLFGGLALLVALEPDSVAKARPAAPRRFKVRLAGSEELQEVVFSGARTEVSLGRAPARR
jgi:hypothetical protein